MKLLEEEKSFTQNRVEDDNDDGKSKTASWNGNIWRTLNKKSNHETNTNKEALRSICGPMNKTRFLRLTFFYLFTVTFVNF